VTVAAISFVMYLVSAFITNAIVLLVIGALLTVATLFVIKKVTADKENA
jgi:ABC-type iron transport system FetAB permease component